MLLLVAMILCSGCAMKVYNGCDLLALKSYPKTYSDKLADEIEKAPADSVWPMAIGDYRALRAAVQACKK